VQISSDQEDIAGMPGLERHLVIARLREEIRRIEHRPGRREGIVPCGLPAVDAMLPGGGFPRGALSELVGGPASGKTAVALSLLAALGPESLVAWVDGRGELYPPAAAARGVDLARLLVVRPSPSAAGGATRPEPPWRSALWACEALLASGAFVAVAMDVAVPRSFPGVDAAGRRLQAAAERGGAVGLWLAAADGAMRLPAAARLELVTEHGRILARRTGEARAAGGGGRAA
jgi:protein ImuA